MQKIAAAPEHHSSPVVPHAAAAQVATREVPKLAHLVDGADPGYRFQVWETQQVNADHQWMHPTRHLRVGPSWDEECMSISITDPGSKLPSAYAALVRVKFYPSCSCGSKPLERGGGSADMVRSVLSFVSSQYGVQRFTLDDTSAITCTDGGNQTVQLAQLMLSYNGMTWYEREFGAMLVSSERHQIYRRRVDHGLDQSAGKQLSFDDFEAAYSLPAEHRDLLRASYDHQETLRAFFADLKAKYPCKHPLHSFCALVAPWVGAVINDVTGGMHNERWAIQAADLKRVSEGTGLDRAGTLGPDGVLPLCTCCCAQLAAGTWTWRAASSDPPWMTLPAEIIDCP